jgi:hypothetical protein
MIQAIQPRTRKAFTGKPVYTPLKEKSPAHTGEGDGGALTHRRHPIKTLTKSCRMMFIMNWGVRQ